jgi:hypothetical protein
MWRNHQHRIPRGKTPHQQEGNTADHQKLKIELSDPHTPTHTKKKRKDVLYNWELRRRRRIKRVIIRRILIE